VKVYVALLRGVNLGRHNRIAMADLRALIEELGFTDPRTHLQSGNAIFRAASDDPDEVARALESRLTVPVMVRTPEELAAVVSGNPFADIATDGARLVVSFLSQAIDPGRAAEIEPSSVAPDRFHIAGREVYAWCPDGLQNSKLSYALWEKRFGVVATARNWNTVTRLLALARE
jgi:uncharacterized protein (DUF1697 family)